MVVTLHQELLLMTVSPCQKGRFLNVCHLYLMNCFRAVCLYFRGRIREKCPVNMGLIFRGYMVVGI